MLFVQFYDANNKPSLGSDGNLRLDGRLKRGETIHKFCVEYAKSLKDIKIFSAYKVLAGQSWGDCKPVSNLVKLGDL